MIDRQPASATPPARRGARRAQRFDDYRANRLLARLPAETLTRLGGDLSLLEIPRGSELYAPGEQGDWVLYPLDGVASIIGQDDTGTGVDVALVGRDGLLGAHAALASLSMPMETIQLISGRAVRMTASSFRKAVDREPSLRKAVARYLAVHFVETAQVAACNRLHGLAARVARWLLMAADRSGLEEMPLTQETLARMAGASRPKVSQAVNAIVASGAVETRRGWVRIIRRDRLEREACDCYGIIREAWERAEDG